jgi:hypothetical protein
MPFEASIILELLEADAVPLIYNGLGTDVKSGVRARFGQYNRGEVLPRYVKDALENDYIIVHKGLLWPPIPSAADFPRFRILFVAMEAVFSFLF